MGWVVFFIMAAVVVACLLQEEFVVPVKVDYAMSLCLADIERRMTWNNEDFLCDDGISEEEWRAKKDELEAEMAAMLAPRRFTLLQMLGNG